MYLSRIEHLTMKNAMFCETCGRRRYKNVERMPRYVGLSDRDVKKMSPTAFKLARKPRQIKWENLHLNLWRYTYECRKCGEIKILIIGHEHTDPQGQTSLHLICGFILKTDDQIVNLVRSDVYIMNKLNSPIVRYKNTKTFGRYTPFYDKFTFGANLERLNNERAFDR